MSKTFKNWLRTLGAPEDPVATDTSSEWSAMSLLKAIFGKINDGSLASGVAQSAETVIRPIAAGTVATVQLSEKRVSADTSAAAVSAGRAEGFAAFAMGSLSQIVNYLKQTRANATATAADAVSTAADAVSTAADVVTVNAQTSIAVDASHRAAGYAMAGSRAVLAQERAETAQAAAEAAAASVPSAEQLALPVQVFS